MNTTAYVIVHGGAGLHSKNSEPEVKQALQLACTETLARISAAGTNFPTALDFVEHAITYLENCPLLNAGHGSNLTLSGTVECDASIMDGRTGDFGSIGAVSGIKNPIRLARAILEHARIPDPLGRIPPLTLVSHGARLFAEQLPPDIKAELLVPPETLITSRATKTWESWKSRLAGISAANTESSTEHDDMELESLQDTVGAVAFTSAAANSGSIACGVSSGGILLKHPGRVGEAAVFGAGCWARAPSNVEAEGEGVVLERTRKRAKFGIACSVSGAGEYIVRANLARAIVDALNSASPSSASSAEEEEEEDVDVHAILQRVLTEEFWLPNRSPTNPDPSAGVVLLTTAKDNDGEVVRLWCVFTTPSMAIAYASSRYPQGKALILRRPKSVESQANDRPRIFATGIAL
ncbi:nucleophile aminohydrolase [Favolaschia claudopus]|uniref:Nucleophile aminohydrolase n=1 Tax=Favolaschia claudopus TaxID=2862362 RepID=A0AAW0AAR2_9AGAR